MTKVLFAGTQKADGKAQSREDLDSLEVEIRKEEKREEDSRTFGLLLYPFWTLEEEDWGHFITLFPSR